MAHPLATYLKEAGVSKAEFARRLGASRQYITNLINHRTGVTLGRAFKIQSLTNGAVTAEALNELQAPGADQ